jgi:hypothetical protein
LDVKFVKNFGCVHHVFKVNQDNDCFENTRESAKNSFKKVNL